MLLNSSRVIIHPTQNATNIILDRGKLEFINNRQIAKTINSIVEGYEIYIISDDKIKTGDYVYIKNKSGSIFIDKCSSVEQNGIWTHGKYYYPYKIDSNTICKKVIASTNKHIKENDGWVEYGDKSNDYIPQIPDSFTKNYIDAYNSSNPIKEVMVEYEQNCAYDFTSRCTQDRCNCEVNIKTDKNNTITIRKIKNSYSRDEVIELFEKYVDQKHPLLYPFLDENL